MHTRPVGTRRLSLSRLCFGAMDRRNLGAEAREGLVRAALDRGMTTIDTAPLYEFGDSERWVGRALAGRRDEVVLATKVGLRWGPDARGDELFGCPDGAGGWRSVKKDSRPSAVRADVEGSLSRLGVDVLDIVQVHHLDLHTPIDETMGALLELRAEGKLREIGISNYDLPACQAAARAVGEVGLATVQVPLNLMDRRVIADVVPWAARRGVGVLAYSPLAEGVLAGRYLDAPLDPVADNPLHHPRNAVPATRLLGQVLSPIAAEHGVPVPAVALAALLALPGVTAAIVGASRAEQLDAAAAAVELELDEGTVSRILGAFDAAGFDPRAGYQRRDRALRFVYGKLARLRGRNSG